MKSLLLCVLGLEKAREHVHISELQNVKKERKERQGQTRKDKENFTEEMRVGK